MPARQAAVKGGIPLDVPSIGLNKACLSGIDAVYLADLMIQAGDADDRGRRGHGVDDPGAVPPEERAGRLPDGQRRAARLDARRRSGVRSRGHPHGREHGAATQAHGRHLTRRAWTTSRRRATSAPRTRRRKGASPRSSRSRSPSARATRSSSTADEGIRPGTTIESLAGLRPAFDGDGTITAGNASQISDGGAAVVVMSRAKAEELGDRAARRAAGLRQRRRPRHVAAPPAVGCDQAGAGEARRGGRRRSTSSRSTRRSPPWASPRCTTSASPTRSST